MRLGVESSKCAVFFFIFKKIQLQKGDPKAYYFLQPTAADTDDVSVLFA